MCPWVVKGKTGRSRDVGPEVMGESLPGHCSEVRVTESWVGMTGPERTVRDEGVLGSLGGLTSSRDSCPLVTPIFLFVRPLRYTTRPPTKPRASPLRLPFVRQSTPDTTA